MRRMNPKATVEFKVVFKRNKINKYRYSDLYIYKKSKPKLLFQFNVTLAHWRVVPCPPPLPIHAC